MRLLRLTAFLFFAGISFAQETKTSMGFALSPNFSSVRYISTANTNQSYFNETKSSTSGAIGLSGNMFFQYELMDKLFINWGLGVQNYRFTYDYTSPFIGTTSKTTRSQYYLQLNASVKYRIYQMLYVRTGIGVDVLADPRLKTTQNTPSGTNVYKGDDFTNFREAMLPVSLGIGYELKLIDRLNLMSELFGTMVLSDALEIPKNSSAIQRKPLQLGFSLGIIRSF